MDYWWGECPICFGDMYGDGTGSYYQCFPCGYSYVNGVDNLKELQLDKKKV